MADLAKNENPGGSDFEPTRWSRVLRAGVGGDSAEGHKALGELCHAYWYPLYAFVRRRGHDHHEAQDLTQKFFAQIIEKHAIKKAEPNKGRFRSFLLAALKNFLANEWDRARAEKRGGGCEIVSLDQQAPDERYAHEPVDERSPDSLYDRRWADTVYERAVGELRQEWESAGKRERFDALHFCLRTEENLASYEQIGRRLGMKEQAVKSAIYRLRHRFGELLRVEIGETVANREEIDAELRYILTILAS